MGVTVSTVQQLAHTSLGAGWGTAATGSQDWSRPGRLSATPVSAAAGTVFATVLGAACAYFTGALATFCTFSGTGVATLAGAACTTGNSGVGAATAVTAGGCDVAGTSASALRWFICTSMAPRASVVAPRAPTATHRKRLAGATARTAPGTDMALFIHLSFGKGRNRPFNPGSPYNDRGLPKVHSAGLATVSEL